MLLKNSSGFKNRLWQKQFLKDQGTVSDSGIKKSQ